MFLHAGIRNQLNEHLLTVDGGWLASLSLLLFLFRIKKPLR
jgi:hypothetical protein